MDNKRYFPLPWEQREQRDEEGRYSDVLCGPNEFECFLGEPEDRTWYRDGSRVVDELNRLDSKLKSLQDYVREQLPDAPVPDELMN